MASTPDPQFKTLQKEFDTFAKDYSAHRNRMIKEDSELSVELEAFYNDLKKTYKVLDDLDKRLKKLEKGWFS